jgi:hypothetical protein
MVYQSYLYIYVCMCDSKYIDVHVYAQKDVYVCIYVSIYIYAETYLRIKILSTFIAQYIVFYIINDDFSVLTK